MTYNIILVSGIQNSDFIFLYLTKLDHYKSSYHCHKSYYNIIDYIPYAVHYTPVTYFITGSLYILVSLTYFTHPPVPISSATTVYSLYLWLCVYLFSVSMTFSFYVFSFAFFFFRFTSHMLLSFSVWHISLSIMLSSPSMLLQTARFIITHGWVIFHCVCMYICVWVYTTS